MEHFSFKPLVLTQQRIANVFEHYKVFIDSWTLVDNQQLKSHYNLLQFI